MSLVPSPFLFRYSIPVVRVDKIPRAKSPLLQLPKQAEIAFPSAMESTLDFARLSMAWNSNGLAISVTVTGKTDWPDCSPDSVQSSDGIQLWLDTRDTQNIHRASRYCHYFCLLPISEGADGMSPVIKQLPISRASDDAPEVDEDAILIESETDETGYTVSVWFPTESLNGFDPDAYSRMGFYISVNDGELGKQFFTVGEEFPFQSDPTLWASLELAAE
jgi:hypothetical protein